MTESERIFTVTHKNRSYPVTGNELTTIETVWTSQKCWFTPGCKVTITDDQGNSKTFIKE